VAGSSSSHVGRRCGSGLGNGEMGMLGSDVLEREGQILSGRLSRAQRGQQVMVTDAYAGR
jgi:hypothetical protein